MANIIQRISLSVWQMVFSPEIILCALQRAVLNVNLSVKCNNHWTHFLPKGLSISLWYLIRGFWIQWHHFFVKAVHRQKLLTYRETLLSINAWRVNQCIEPLTVFSLASFLATCTFMQLAPRQHGSPNCFRSQALTVGVMAASHQDTAGWPSKIQSRDDKQLTFKWTGKRSK